MLRKFGVLGAGCLALSAACGGDLTFANPLDLAYRMRPEEKANFREGADPEIVLHDGRYWLFASKCGGYFVSDDLAVWRLVKTSDLPLEEYAPTVVELDGRLHFSSRGGTVWRAIDPLAGKWEKISGRIPSCDSALFLDDDGRLYDYEGGSSKTKQPIRVYEIDRATFRAKSEAGVPCFTVDRDRYGYEVRGDGNELTAAAERLGCLEGSHMLKHGGRYYFQFAGPGTEFATYCDTALIGTSPTGPFARQRLNPFSFKPFGYEKGAGHGATFHDKHGNVWHVTTCTHGGVDRRIVLLPVFFDVDGEMWCDTAFADWPLVIPDGRCETPEAYHTGWMPLCDGKRATASSNGGAAGLATDVDARTHWDADAGKGEWLRVDLGAEAEVCAVQVGFAECDAYAAWRTRGATRRWRIEATADDAAWQTIANGEGVNDHPYRALATPVRATALRVVCEGLPEGARFAVRDLRAFGRMEKPVPNMPGGLKVVRDAADPRHVELSWEVVPGATGYLVRYGPTPEKMHLSQLVRGATALSLRNLDAKETYHWSVSAYNEAGFSHAGEEDFTFLQATDMHMTENPDIEPRGALSMKDKFMGKCFLDIVNGLGRSAEKPAFIALTGDETSGVSMDKSTWARAEFKWRHYRKYVTDRLEIPWYQIIGNNDCAPVPYTKVYPERPLRWTFERGGILFVALHGYDCWEPRNSNHAGIRYGEEQLAWLAGLVKNSKARTLVLITHEPLVCDDSHVARAQLAPIVASFRGEAVWNIAGHEHRNHVTSYVLGGRQVTSVETMTPVGGWKIGDGCIRRFRCHGGRIIGSELFWMNSAGDLLRIVNDAVVLKPPKATLLEDSFPTNALAVRIVGRDPFVLGPRTRRIEDRIADYYVIPIYKKDEMTRGLLQFEVPGEVDGQPVTNVLLRIGSKFESRPLPPPDAEGHRWIILDCPDSKPGGFKFFGYVLQ